MDIVEITAQYLAQLNFWINDNIGEQDGCQHIRAIWKDDPKMAEHLVDKWNGYRRMESENTGIDDDTDCSVQKLAFLDLIISLDYKNRNIISKYIMENGRSE